MAKSAQQRITGPFFWLLSLALLTLPGHGYAHTSIAWVHDQAVTTTYAAWDFSTKGKADVAALEGCRTRARSAGLGKLASQCRVGHRQMGAGAGAIVCGKKGCATRTGHETVEDAMRVAYDSCVREKYESCQTSEITTWWDEAGFQKQAVKGNAGPTACRPPPGQPVRSTTQCASANCTRTYENGCSVRFVAPYCLAPSTGKSDWKPDGC